MSSDPTIAVCHSCGKQYRVSAEFFGKVVRCKACGNEFTVEDPAAHQDPEYISASQLNSSQGGTRSADEIDYEIFGDDTQYVEVTLDPDEMVIAEAGAMMYMTSGIKMDTVMGNPSAKGAAASGGGGFWSSVLSAGKRALTGESIFMTTFSNHGLDRERVAFAAPYPGRIIALDLCDFDGEIICQKESFLAGARGIQVGIAFQKRIMVGLFGGEGFIMQRLSGDGIVLVHSGGTLRTVDLAPGEQLRMDTGCLVALTKSVEFDVQFVGGFKNTLFGGEGLFMATVTGPGRVWMQSLPFSRLAGRIVSAAPGVGKARKGEGSVLDWVGGIGNMIDGD